MLFHPSGDSISYRFPRWNLHKVILFGIINSVIALAAAVAACAGGGGTGSALQAPPPIPHQSPSPVSTSVPFSDVGVAVALPAASPFTEAITVPSNNQSATANTFSVSIATQSFNGLPQISSIQRRPLVQRIAANNSHPTIPFGATPLLYFAVASSAAASFTAIPSLEIGGLPQELAGNEFFLLVYDPTNAAAGWQTTNAQPTYASGSTVSLSGAGFPFSILASTQYGLAVVSCVYC
jgi:hypothetical protein